MSLHFKPWWGAALGLALCLSGCNSATAPVSLSDPLTTAAQAAAVDSAFNAPTIASFQSLGSAIHPAPPVARAALGALQALPRTPPGADRYAALATEGRALRALVPGFASFAASGIFADTLLGSVFTWNTVSSTYTLSSHSGGPANGIRFLLYAIDPLTDRPATPLNQVGYADLMDESSGGMARLHIQVKNTGGTVTYLDYTFSGSGTSSSFSASVSGFIANGLVGAANKTLSFDVTITGTTSSVALASSYHLNSPDVTVQESVTIADDGTTTTLTLDFTFSRTGETVTITGTVAVSDADGSGTVNLTFKVNGRSFATLTGSTTTPTFTKAGGGELTVGEKLALVRLFEAAADVGDKIDGMFKPAENVLGF